jgi:hypothetical protein
VKCNLPNGIVNLLSALYSSSAVCHTSYMSIPSTHRDKNHRFPAEIISHSVWLYFRFWLSYRDIEELLFARGVRVSYPHDIGPNAFAGGYLLQPNQSCSLVAVMVIIFQEPAQPFPTPNGAFMLPIWRRCGQQDDVAFPLVGAV